MEGEQHKDRHQKDSAHQRQQHVAAYEQGVNYLQGKEEPDEVISINWNDLHFHLWPPGVSRGLLRRFVLALLKKKKKKKGCFPCE